MREHGPKGAGSKNSTPDKRHVLIVRMTPDFMQVDKVVLFQELEQTRREAFWLFKKGLQYYMSESFFCFVFFN